MHELYQLKEMLLDELGEIGSKGELTAGSLETVEKLSTSIKNICEIVEDMEEEGEYSMRGGSNYYSYEGGQGGGSSRYSRRRSGGRYSREGQGGGENYMRGGRYSRNSEDMAMRLEQMMQEAPDEATRQEFQRLVNKMRGGI
jgi:hypothetical protein